MGKVRREDEQSTPEWQGRAGCLVEKIVPSGSKSSNAVYTLPIAVPCRVGGVPDDHLALLDTAAQWSLLGGDLAKLVRPLVEAPGDPFSMHTRLGSIHGELVRIPITLVADKGKDLVIDATLLLAEAWSGPPVVLGYRGLLERIRFGIDPGPTGDDPWWFFGDASSR